MHYYKKKHNANKIACLFSTKTPIFLFFVYKYNEIEITKKEERNFYTAKLIQIKANCVAKVLNIFGFVWTVYVTGENKILN